MSDTIIKPKPGEDFYVVYSSVVDSPTYFGSRDQLRAIYRDAAEDRFNRADAFGSSCLWASPPEFGWQDETVMVREGIKDPTRPFGAFYGDVNRSDLREFCESIEADGYFHPRPGLVAWHEEAPDD